MSAESLDLARYAVGWWRLGPELTLAVGAAVLLVVEAFARPSSGRRPAFIAAGTVALSLVIALITPSSQATIFAGLVVIDPFVEYFRVLLATAALLGLLLSFRSSEVERQNAPEYYALYLALVFGMMLMAAASDLIMMMLAIEIVSLMSYVLSGLKRRHKRSAEAALKYVVYGGAASGAMFFGFSILYGLTGHTHFSLIHDALLSDEVPRQATMALSAAIALVFAGMSYKIAAVPMHMWSPDVYEGAPTPFTAFLSTGPKAAGFAAIIRFFYVVFADQTSAQGLLVDIATVPWVYLFVVSAVLTMTVGNLAAIGQSNIKRFLAYSSIAHAGYALIGVAAFSRAGVAAVLIYLAFYIVMNIGTFYVVIWVRQRTGHELIEDYRGLGQRAPLVGIALTICLFSLTGLPPLAGFIGKYYVFAAALERGFELGPAAACATELQAQSALTLKEHLTCTFSGGNAFHVLAIIGVLNSAVSLYYYARIVRKMFLERPVTTDPLEVDGWTRAVLLPISAFLVFFGIYWAPLKTSADAAVSFHRPTLEQLDVDPRARAGRALSVLGGDASER